jgi:DNA-binding MarR family transcriptional regulator
MKAHGELTLPEIAALTRLDRGGPMTGAALAKLEQISPQSMGVTLGALEARDLVERRSDPDDRRQALTSITTAGAQVLTNGRNASRRSSRRASRPASASSPPRARHTSWASTSRSPSTR